MPIHARLLALAGLLALPGAALRADASSAIAGVSTAHSYRVEAYLDEAPRGGLEEEFEIADGARLRKLVLIRAELDGANGSGADLQDVAHPYRLYGTPTQIAALFEAPRGARVSGAFTRLFPSNTLVIRAVDVSEPPGSPGQPERRVKPGS